MARCVSEAGKRAKRQAKQGEHDTETKPYRQATNNLRKENRLRQYRQISEKQNNWQHGNGKQSTEEANATKILTCKAASVPSKEGSRQAKQTGRKNRANNGKKDRIRTVSGKVVTAKTERLQGEKN